jgi:hypothetical protein
MVHGLIKLIKSYLIMYRYVNYNNHIFEMEQWLAINESDGRKIPDGALTSMYIHKDYESMLPWETKYYVMRGINPFTTPDHYNYYPIGVDRGYKFQVQII